MRGSLFVLVPIQAEPDLTPCFERRRGRPLLDDTDVALGYPARLTVCGGLSAGR